MFLEQNVQDILNIATEKGLKNVEIRITENIMLGNEERGTIELWANGKDRFSCSSLDQPETALEDHEDLRWMN